MSIVSALSSLSFMQPIILSGLLALPILWYILRITPPSPKTIFFPAVFLMEGLYTQEKTPSSSPWWILLLRLLIAALIIIALARPVLNPAQKLDYSGDIRIFLDNGWAGAQNWSMQMTAAEEIITQAMREKRNVYILSATNATEDVHALQSGPMAAAEGRSILRGLHPYPWPANYQKLAAHLEKQGHKSASIHTFWLSHGLDDGGASDLMRLFKKHGSLHIFKPEKESLPLLLRPSQKTKRKGDLPSDVRIAVDGPSDIDTTIGVTVQVSAQNGAILDARSERVSSRSYPHTVFFDVTDKQKRSISRFDIVGRKSAGSSYILDDQFKKRRVGIVSNNVDDRSAPLIEAEYYLKRAVEPYADIALGSVSEILDQQPSTIILPDVAAMPTEILNALEAWVKDGGLLLRFSGPNMAGSVQNQILTPVALRAGGRSLSGSLSWEKPQSISPFSKNSPFYGLDIPSDVNVRQQVLADPTQDITERIWARLEDGTPFITASPLGSGRLVLVHTTANTDWSDFALSGLYVKVLKRIIYMSGIPAGASNGNESFSALDPLLIMDGFGNMRSPSAHVKPLPAGSYETISASAIHPPGIYGRGSIQFALNLGGAIPALKTIGDVPTGVVIKHYEHDYEVDIMPHILFTAIILFLIDWLVMITLSGQLRHVIKKSTALMLFYALIFTCIMTPNAQAQNDNDLQTDIKYASGFYLAYIETGDDALDQLTQMGLETLADVLSSRTSIEPSGVAAINPEQDTMSFFPIIYWSISPAQKNYSAKALEKIQRYLDQGGTILFDTRDQSQGSKSFSNTQSAKKLRQITSSLNIPPIVPIPDDHVLGRAFYLLDHYPGRYNNGTLWIEKNSAQGRDNVSSVFIGSHDWVGSWADSQAHSPTNRYSARYDTKQKEMALRFGVNLIMHSMTGNYKADQVHIPHILERLGE